MHWKLQEARNSLNSHFFGLIYAYIYEYMYIYIYTHIIYNNIVILLLHKKYYMK